jgi:Arm DNA-binding domain
MTNKPARGRNQMKLTDLGIKQLKPQPGYTEYWDTDDERGLSLLVSESGKKTFRSTYRLAPNGTQLSRKLGRFPNLREGEARRLHRWHRDTAARAINPRDYPLHKVREAIAEHKDPITEQRLEEAKERALATTYEAVVDRFIKEYARPRQRTFDQTEWCLKRTCASFIGKPFGAITKADVRSLLNSFVNEGKVYKAANAQAWLKKLWRWAAEHDIVDVPIMDAVRIEYEKRERARVYSDDELRAIWLAADKLEDQSEAAFTKLILLLAPRRTALAAMTIAHLDFDRNIWTTPFELTKSKKTVSKRRVYLTPLPAMALRILKGMPLPSEPNARLFPSLALHKTKGGQLTYQDGKLQRRLIEHGAPADFAYHAMRHTIATWFENRGYSEWERGLVLNHSGTGTVTGGYSHGYPLELKLKLLTEWAGHIEDLLPPAHPDRLPIEGKGRLRLVSQRE